MWRASSRASTRLGVLMDVGDSIAAHDLVSLVSYLSSSSPSAGVQICPTDTSLVFFGALGSWCDTPY